MIPGLGIQDDESTSSGLSGVGFRVRDIAPAMKNQMDNRMESEMETGIIQQVFGVTSNLICLFRLVLLEIREHSNITEYCPRAIFAL